ncbi:unnamed protein product [Cylicocyclus nassatus]|uniref:RING-CH-type domain-containing protein n=1 Tax=Cylicocyclus nassatus TaxID=53992 RepID=A0AA36H6V4_CYLNA|nr:unnamed protein product [Cylicocyclus nassatus]
METSSSDSVLRRTGIICSKTGEKLGTIEEELTHWIQDHRKSTTKSIAEYNTPKKSATFHNIVDLQKTGAPRPHQSNSDQQIKNLAPPRRKRSLFYEMGERIRLFSAGSFVTTVPVSPHHVSKTQSLNSFCETTNSANVASPSRRPMKKSRSRVAQGSVVSLQNNDDFSIDMDSYMAKAPSQLGILCQHCSTTDLPCPKAHQEHGSPSLPSLYSLAPSDLSGNEPLCRICHCCWPSDASDPLISPCRCSGSLQYVHVSCLMHWLDISSRKLHRPAVCELCLYKYRRRRVLKYREIKLPDCSDRDVRYYTLFVCALIMMILSALATIVCFQLEKSYSTHSNKTSSTPLTPSEITPPELPAPTDLLHREDIENLLSTVTLIAAILFFFSFFMAMYAHVKSGISFCGYISLCWSSNLEWTIEEYKQSRDSQYLSKLEELRRKINEKQKKAPDEVEPLRSSVIVIE